MAFSGRGAFPDRSNKLRSSPAASKNSNLRRPEGDCSTSRICSSPVFTRSPSRAEGEFKRPCSKVLSSPKTLDLKENGHGVLPRRSPLPEKTTSKVVVGSSRWSSIGSRMVASPSPNKRILGDHNDTVLAVARKSRKEWQIPDPCVVQLKESLSGVASPSETVAEAVESFPVVNEAIKEEVVEERGPTTAKKVPAVAKKKLFGAGIEGSTSTMTHDQVLSMRTTERCQKRSSEAMEVKHPVIFMSSKYPTTAVQPEAPSQSPASQHSSSGSSTVDGAQEEEQSTEETLSGGCAWKPAMEVLLLNESVGVVKTEDVPVEQATEVCSVSQKGSAVADQEATAVAEQEVTATGEETVVPEQRANASEKEATAGEKEDTEEAVIGLKKKKKRNGLRTLLRISSWCLLLVALTFVAASYVSRGTSLHQLWTEGCKHQALFFAANDIWTSEPDFVGLYVDPQQIYENAKYLAWKAYANLQDGVQSLQPQYVKLKAAFLSFIEILVPLIQDKTLSFGRQLSRWYLLSKHSVSRLEHVAYKALVEEYLGNEQARTEPGEQQLNVEHTRDIQVDAASVTEQEEAASQLEDIRHIIHEEPDPVTPAVLQRVEPHKKEAEDGESRPLPPLSIEEGGASAVLQIVELQSTGDTKMEGAASIPASEVTSLLSDEEVDGSGAKENLFVKVEALSEESQAEFKGLDTIPEADGNSQAATARLSSYFIFSALVIGALALGVYATYPKQLQKKKKQPAKRQQRVSPQAEIFRSVEPVRPNKFYGTPEQLRLLGADEQLVLTPEQPSESPYGSFTAFKQVVLSEGSGKEHVKLTPVRRSNRIRNQLLSCKQ